MNVQNVVTLKQIAEYLKNAGESFSICGDMDDCVLGASSLHRYKEGTVTWIKNLNNYYKSTCKELNPALIVIDREVDKVSNYTNKLVCDNPKYIFSLILKGFFEEKSYVSAGEGSFISKRALIDKNVSIGYGCVIEDDVTIGEGTKIYHNVVIRRGTVIGKKCIIKSGTVIGEEGYGYSTNNDMIIHVPHLGNVVIEDEAEIGSNCSIDRGTIESTIIGKRCKIDNLCHIAHNVQIEKNVMVVAGSVICGSVYIKSGAYIAPGGIIKNQLEIGENCVVGMGSVVLNDMESGKVVVGVPARNLR
jgi:UDP-3-O-[3-hydroxymyristoyl] glucosamine N-acyltransferase